MKTLLKKLFLAAILIGVTATVSQAAAEQEHQHPSAEAAMTSSAKMDMMREQMSMMPDGGRRDVMPCMASGQPCPKPCRVGEPPARHHGMGDGMPGMHGMMGMGHDSLPMKPGMMQHRMDHMFFLDRIAELDLSREQVTRLKALRAACRKENIGLAAEAQVARLELHDLLSESDWSPDDAEPLVRRIQQLEGDMLLRHLRASAEARQVLSAEQLRRAATDDGDIESLFK